MPLTLARAVVRFWWGAPFLINVPVVDVAVTAASVLVPESLRAGPSPPLVLCGSSVTLDDCSVAGAGAQCLEHVSPQKGTASGTIAAR